MRNRFFREALLQGFDATSEFLKGENLSCIANAKFQCKISKAETVIKTKKILIQWAESHDVKILKVNRRERFVVTKF